MKPPRKRIHKDGKWYTTKGLELVRNSGWMTEPEFWSMLRSALRRLTVYWKPKGEVLLQARSPYQGTNKRLKWQYKCAHCKKNYSRAEVEIDHIIPCGNLTSYESCGTFIKRLFVEAYGWQVLCKPCHLEKTNKEKI